MAVSGIPLWVVIVTFGPGARLHETLLSLEKCDRPRNYQGTVLVENGGTRGAELIAGRMNRLTNVRYLSIESPSKCVALNRALRDLPSESLVVFFDDDVRIEAQALLAYAEAADGNDKGVFFGGPTGVEYERRPPEWMRPFLPGSALGTDALPKSWSICVDYFLGFNWSAFLRDLKSAGGFNTAFGPGTRIGGGDETLMQQELKKIGRRPVFVKGAKVWHYVPPDRCSPKWAIQRAYWAGYVQGVRSAAADEPHCSHSSQLRNSVNVARRCIRNILGERITRKKEAVGISLRYQSNWLKGYYAGYGYGRREKPLADPSNYEFARIGE